MESTLFPTDPQRIMLAGDWHGNTMWGVSCIHHAGREGVDTIVHLGDFGFWNLNNGDTTKYFRMLHRALEERNIILVWVDGNHENHDQMAEFLVDRKPWSLSKYPRIIHAPRGHRWEWWDQTWMAVGGAVSVDRFQRTLGKSWWEGEVINDGDVAYASREGKVDIIVAHDCPFGVDIPGIGPVSKQRPGEPAWPPVLLFESEFNRRRLRDIVEAVKPKLYFHGHYHLRYQALYQFAQDLPNMRVYGLDCDGTSIHRNTMILNKGNQE